MRNAFTAMVMAVLFFPLYIFAQTIPTPKQHFGHQMGTEGKIINFFDGLKYYQKLAERSDRIRYTELGKTTDGNPFVLLIISAPENLQRLEEIKKKRDQLSDPRKLSESEATKLANELPAVVFHTSSIHTTEISTAQVVPELVYWLVSGQSDAVQRILKNTIVLVSPSANPDGQVKIKKWYDEHEGKDWEARMPWLYHTYVGHDNNRDWVLLHFPEQRLTAQKIHMAWHPIYSHEMHQMGGSGARLFVPPYQDPYDVNTAPEVMETMAMVGMAMSHRLISEGKAGVVKNAIYDLFTPARAFQIYRGTGRVLTETASANFARKRVLEPKDLRSRRGGTGIYDPLKKSWNFPLPWEGGEWTFRQMVEYQLSASKAALNLVSSDPAAFNMAFYRSLKRAVDGDGWPYAYVFPAEQADPSSAARLLQAMQRGGIEIHKATSAFSADGKRFEKGSHIIILRQPYAAWAKTVLEIQEYPDLRRSPDEPPIVPYDVTAQTLPMMMGVQASKIDRKFKAAMSRVTKKVDFAGQVNGTGNHGFVILPNSNEAYSAADALLDSGYGVAQLTAASSDRTQMFPSGSFYVKPRRGLSQEATELAGKWSFTALEPSDASLLDGAPLSNPRIGIYEPWGGLMDAGWTRFVLEQFELEPMTVRNADIKGGNLARKYDIIFFPDGLTTQRVLKDETKWPEKYRGGIGEDGKAALTEFVNHGGTVAAFGRSSMVLVDLLDLPISNTLAELSPQEYFAPGSLILAELDQGSPLAFGLAKKVAVMNRRGPAFAPKATTEGSPEMVGRYPDYDPRLSGFLLGPEHIEGKGAIAVQSIGQGRAILFSMNPQFRAMTHGTYKLVFNAIFWAARRDQSMQTSD
ncbi:MAG: M14 family zinc carboxypeptidase [bacterium]